MSEEREMLAGWLGQMIDDAETDGHRITINVAAAKRLRAALSGVPEGAASEPLDEVRRMVAYELRDTDDWADYVDITVPLSRMRAIRDALAARLAVPSPEPLDAARLAMAMRGGPFNDAWHYEDAAKAAAVLAREYASLAAPQPVPEDET